MKPRRPCSFAAVPLRRRPSSLAARGLRRQQVLLRRPANLLRGPCNSKPATPLQFLAFCCCPTPQERAPPVCCPAGRRRQRQQPDPFCCATCCTYRRRPPRRRRRRQHRALKRRQSATSSPNDNNLSSPQDTGVEEESDLHPSRNKWSLPMSVFFKDARMPATARPSAVTVDCYRQPCNPTPPPATPPLLQPCR